MDIWKSLDGMVEAELTSAEPGAALEAANARGIPLYDVIQVGDLTARFRVRRRDYQRSRGRHPGRRGHGFQISIFFT